MKPFRTICLSAMLIAAIPAYSQQSDLTGLILGMAENNPIEYQSVMEQFVAASKASDIERMIALTSPITRKQQSEDTLRTLYKEQYVLMFTLFPNISQGGGNTLVNDPSGSHGWIFTRTASSNDGKDLPIYVVVLEEDGNKYVSAVGVKE